MATKLRRAIDISLALLGFAYLALWYLKIESNNSSTRSAMEISMISLNALFAIDYVWRLSVSNKKINFLKNNLIELVAIVFPFFRALRAFRVVLAVLQLVKIRESRRLSTNFFLIVALPLLMLGSALAILDAEGDVPGTKISSFTDAIWWSFSTLTTVGYGDIFPVSVEGRVVAAVLVLFGLGSLSVLTANIASWFIEADRNPTKTEID
jgi:voltage-gated potassium channel